MIGAVKPADPFFPANTRLFDFIGLPASVLLVAFLVADHFIIKTNLSLPVRLHMRIHQPHRQVDTLEPGSLA